MKNQIKTLLDKNINKPEEMHLIIEEVLSLLKNKVSSETSTFLESAIIELTLNAFKAYQKRQFFKMNGLDFHNDYEKGNALFKKAFKNGELDIQETTQVLNCRINFIVVENDLECNIFIQSSTVMNPEEIKIVQQMIKNGEEIEDMKELIETENDGEGGGIGLTLLSHMMKKAGLRSENLTFKSEEFTVFRLKIPKIL